MRATRPTIGLSFGSGMAAVASNIVETAVLALPQLPLAGISITPGLRVSHGEGKHIIFLTNLEGFSKVALVPMQEFDIYQPNITSLQICVGGVVVYSFTVIFIKLSILYLYHKIFPSRGLIVAAGLTAVLVVAYNAAVCLLSCNVFLYQSCG